MKLHNWLTMMESLFDEHHNGEDHKVPGVNLEQWSEFLHCDWNEMDRVLLDYETQGG